MVGVRQTRNSGDETHGEKTVSDKPETLGMRPHGVKTVSEKLDEPETLECDSVGRRT